MDEHGDFEREWQEERAKRQEKTKKRQEALRRKIILAVVVALVVCAGVFAAFSMSKNKEKPIQEKIPYNTFDVADEYESFDIPEGERETLEAGHISDELPKIDVLISICPHDSDWTFFAADNRCALAPVGSYITGFKAALKDQPSELSGTVRYTVNVSGIGWIDWEENAQEAGSSGSDMALEAIRMELTGDLADHYDILYCVLQNDEWCDWVMNGEEAGISGEGLHVDGIRASVSRRRPGETSYAGEINPNKPMVALTYDDGPSKTETGRILDKLESVGGHATFFMVGSQAERNPDLVKRMTDLGCEPANHTYNHIFFKNLNQEEVAEQLELTNQTVYNCSGLRPLLVRPPGGDETEISLAVIGAMAMPAILWSIDTRDWETRDAAQTIDKVLTNVSDGDVILMHDLYEPTADASMVIIDTLVSQGYQLVTVSEISAYRGGLKPGETYRHFWNK